LLNPTFTLLVSMSPADRLNITADEKTILHLLQFTDHENEFEMPPDVTQKGISQGIGIHRKHVPRTIKSLIAKGVLKERMGHVKGHPQRVKGYFLTREGLERAHRLWEHLQRETVYVRGEDGELEETNFGQLFFTHQIYLTPVQVLIRLDDNRVFKEEGEVDPADLLPVSRPSATEKDDKIGIYRAALAQAWADRVLTVDELGMLEELRRIMGISEKDHRRIESEITADKNISLSTKEVFAASLKEALADGKITDDEMAILDRLQESMGISVQERRKIEKEVSKENK
jgi:DNA-binding MarR family transcriptional regulator